MNSKGNKVVLILVVSLAAFSSAMKELNEVRKFGLEAEQFLARLSDRLTPAEVPAQVVAQIRTCESKQSEPSVELPWLENNVAQPEEIADIEEPEAATPVVAKRTRASRVEPVKAKRLRRVDVDPVQFEVRILNNHDGQQYVPAIDELPLPSSTFRFKSHKNGFIKINPRDLEMLKTLNRSINLRSAG